MTAPEHRPPASLLELWADQRMAELRTACPPRFRGDVALPLAIEGWLRRLDLGAERPPSNLLLVGPVGTGKTSAAWTVARRAARLEATTVEFATAGGFARGARMAGEDPGEFLDRLCAARLLVLDDVGAQTLTPWLLDAIEQVADRRYEAMRPTLVTTNVADLRGLLGERTASRLSQDATVVTLVGADRRRS